MTFTSARCPVVKSVARCLALLLIVTHPALAATGAAQAPSVKIRLLAFSRVGEEMETAITDPQGKPMTKTPVPLPTQQLSPVQEVAGRSLLFTAPSAPTKILGKVNLPSSGDEFVLVFLPAAKDSAQPYHVDAAGLSNGEFRSGDYAFINYCGDDVGCDVAGQRLLVPHGKVAVYQSAKAAKGGGNRSLVCYRRKGGTWEGHPFFSSRIIVQEGVRNLILVCLDPSSGRIDFRGISDFVD